MHADAVHAGVVRVSPVGQHLQLNHLEGLLRRLLYVTTRTAVTVLFVCLCICVGEAAEVYMCKPQHHLPIKSQQTVNVWDHPIGNTHNVCQVKRGSEK